MSEHSFQKSLSSVQLLLLSVSAIFGSGWLFAPLYAAKIAGPYSLISWVIGAAMSAVVGITMAEVITMYPKNGGVPQVGLLTHGRMVHFLTSALSFLVFILLPVVEVRAVLQYASTYSADLIFNQGQFTLIGATTAGVLLILASMANLWGVKVISKITTLAVVLKLIAPAVMCLLFLRHALQSDHSLFENFRSGLTLVGQAEGDSAGVSTGIPWDEIFLAVSTSGIIFSFSGFNQATIFAGESANPKKSVPFAILGSLVLTLVLYLLIQFVFLISVPSDHLMQGWKNLTFVGEYGPFAGIAVLLGLSSLLPLIYADAFISPIGTAFTYASAAPRGLYALLQEFQSLKKITALNQNGISAFAIGCSFLLEMLALFFLPSLRQAVTVLVAAFVFCYSVAPVSLLVLRKVQPTLHRPFRLEFPVLFCYFSLFFTQVMVFCCDLSALISLLVGCLLTFALGLKLFDRKVNLAAAWLLIDALALVSTRMLYERGNVSFLFCLLLLGVVSGGILFLGVKTALLSTDTESDRSQLFNIQPNLGARL